MGHSPPGPPGGGRGPGGPGGPGPDLDELIRKAQEWLRSTLFLPGGGGGAGSGRVIAILAVLALGAWAASGIYRVQPDELGVVLRFGAYHHRDEPGLNYHMPWPIEVAETPRVTTENLVFIGFRSGDPSAPRAGTGRDVLEESLMLTGDENIIDIDFVVRWRIGSAPDFLFNTRNPEVTIKSAAESMMREVIGRTPIQPALTEARGQIETQVAQGTQAILDQYKAGVVITQVQLQKVDPRGGHRGLPRRPARRRRQGAPAQRGRGLPQRHHPPRPRRGGADDAGSPGLPGQPGGPRPRRGDPLHQRARRLPAGPGHHHAAPVSRDHGGHPAAQSEGRRG
ncbi:protease modulator HflK [Paeniroseomonas aquatica]|uniref:protease modulator HflK n=1 Tax=Paeniroseomonas aquatica TaxID=373043 RepID=UPI0036245763